VIWGENSKKKKTGNMITNVTQKNSYATPQGKVLGNIRLYIYD